MPLKVGTRLGRYEIRGLLGVGGMGEVYRAFDDRLNREVALKVLRGEVMGDPDFQRRFAQEARAVSALNHPNILTVHDVGLEESTPYIVSEVVEGDPLSDSIEHGPLPVRKGLEIAVQIAAGLDAAHAAGIVHRDLKPGNIMVARNGAVKILDFGIAKTSRAVGAAATTQHTSTMPGMIIGTAAFMSPEQARGDALDFRSDQFSFGLILYRMLTGQGAFDRPSAMGTMAAILDEEYPPVASLNPTVPAQLRWCVERCLSKDREQRYASSHDLYCELKTLLERLPEITTQTRPAVTSAPKRRLLRVALGALAVLAAGAAGFAAYSLFGSAHSVDLTQYHLAPLATDGAYEGSPAWSPDGKEIAYVADVNDTRQVFVRALGSPTAAHITRMEADCEGPFWSPDRGHVYFRSAGALWSVPVAGGPPEKVHENVLAAALSPDGNTLAFLRAGSDGKHPLSLWIASPPSAQARKHGAAPLESGQFREGHLGFSRNAAKLGLWLARWDGSSEFWVLSYPEGAPKSAFKLLQGAWPFHWLPDNRSIVFGGMLPGTNGSELHVADTTSGAIIPVTASIQESILPAPSPDGKTLAFTAANDDFDLVEIPLDGSALRPLLSTARDEFDPTWSPSSDQYAYSTNRSGPVQIWLRNRAGDWERPIVTAADFGDAWIVSLSEPSFAPDGARIAYVAVGENRHAIYISNVKGAPPMRLTRQNLYQRSPSWNPQGDSVAYLQNVGGSWALAKARSGGDAEPVVLRDHCLRSHPKWSKRGDWIACTTAEGLTLVSPDGQTSKVLSRESWLVYGWNSAGTALYGIQEGPGRTRLLATIDVDSGAAKVIADLNLSAHAEVGCYSLSPDGKSFTTSVNRPRADIWTLQGFTQPRRWLRR